VGVDFLVMTLAFLVVNGAKRGTFALPEGYGLLLGLELLVWAVAVRLWGGAPGPGERGGRVG